MSVLLLLGAAGAAVIVFGSLTVKLLTVLAILSVWYLTRRPQGLPPGPKGVPLLGYIPFLDQKKLHQQFNLLSKKYGPVFSVYMGNELTVILNDYTSIRKALVEQGDVFSGRPHLPGAYFINDDKGLLFANRPSWREQRRFALSTLRDFGIGKTSLEPAIQDEIHYFLKVVEEINSKPFDIESQLFMSICNNICILEFGRRFNYEDPYFVKLNSAIKKFLHGVPTTGIHVVFPWLKRIPGGTKIGNLQQVIEYGKSIREFTDKMTKEHKATYEPGIKDDYLNAHFTEAEERKRTGNFPEFFDDRSLDSNLRILFTAGTDTTATTLRWAILFMMLHPDVQRKVQKEIDDVVGRQRLPNCDDRPSLPYTEAALIEVQRRKTLVPLDVPHSTMDDVDFYGYMIPKGTTIIPNLWSVHHDEKLFPDPMSFRPERYINEQGQYSKPEHVIPFSVGKRFCLGEPLARMELFLYFASMLQKFTFKAPPGEPLNTEEHSGIVNGPKPFRTIAIPREE